MPELRRYDPNQKRDPDGKWGDGIPGPRLDLGNFDPISSAEGTFGELLMGVDDVGDVRLAFHEGSRSHEVDLSAEEIAELGDALERLSAARGDLPDGAESGGVYDDERFGAGNDHKVELYGSGVIGVIFGADEPDPYVLLLDPPDEETDDVQAVVDAIDDVLNEVDAARSQGVAVVAEARRYNPNQPRDPGGENGGQWTKSGGAAGGLRDVLKLAGKIQLDSDEKLLGSEKVDGDAGGIRMALTEQDGRRKLRFGAGAERYGQRDRDNGTPAWDGNPSREPLSAEQRQRLDAESDALDAEYDSASPERQAKIQARLDDIREQLTADDAGFNGTAKLDEYSMRRLADKIGPALTEAVEQDKAENKAWDEIDALEAKGNPDPERMAQLRQTVDRDLIVFDRGIVPGTWGDVHYSVELDDPSVGPYVTLGVQPKDAPDDWGDDKDWQGTFDAAETRKFLRLLDKLLGDTSSRSRHGREAQMSVRAFQPEDHPRAPAGTDTGGQFAKAGAAAKKSAAATVKSKSSPSRHPRRRSDDGTLSYDPSSNHGTGYDSKNGDPRVHDLQRALTRLGIKDSSGRELKDDGKLGPKTTSAVKALQRRLGLKPDGKVTAALLKQITSMKSLPAQKRSGAMSLCVRSFGFESTDERGDGRTLEGYAAVFGASTRIAAMGGDFDEVIQRGAFTRSLKTRTPVLQWDHGKDPSVGTAPIGDIEELREDDHGLYVRARLYDHPSVDRVRMAIQGRSVKGMSFRFQVPDGGDRWERRSGNVDLRTVADADVFELGPVAFPAYDATTVSVRSLLAQLDPGEHRSLIRELAEELRLAVDLTDFTGRPGAWSAGGGDLDLQPSSGDRSALSPEIRRLEVEALRALGAL